MGLAARRGDGGLRPDEETMGWLGWPELILIALLALVLFGPRRLPEIGKGLGEGIRSFRAALKAGDHDEPPQKEPDDKIAGKSSEP